MKISKLTAFSLSCFFGLSANAEVGINISCFVHQTSSVPAKFIKFTLRSYFDNDIKKEIGGFIRYESKKHEIPIVFEKHVETDKDNPGLGNFENHWLEIFEGKVTGRYVLIQTGGGNRQGQYIDYYPSNSKKVMAFQKYGNDNDCRE